MLGSGLIAFFFGIGLAAWIYPKIAKRTGYGNNRPAYIATAVIGFVGFLIMFTIFKFVLHV